MFPNWRQHPSLKGWQSMNYPSTLQSPLLQRHKPKPRRDIKLFSNVERPSTQPVQKMHRTFTGSLEPGLKYQPTTVPQSAAIAGIPEDDLRVKLYQPANELQSHSALTFGKTINTANLNDNQC